MDSVIKNEKWQYREINVKLIAICFLSACVLLAFVKPDLSIVVGPVMALLMCYLFFNDYSEVVTAIILVANDDLGTIIFGKISFPYLLLILVAVKLIQKKRFTNSEMIFLIVSGFLIFELYFVGFLPFRSVIYSLTFILSFLTIGREEKEWEKFFLGVGLIVVLISLHACITGGVEFYEVSLWDNGFIRKGILGVGVIEIAYIIGIDAIHLIHHFKILAHQMHTSPIFNNRHE